jgi:protein-L-isoaspartate(D-aspartate) O-methyltransferase
VIVTAAAPDIPQSLLDQLAVGGRLVIPVGSHEVQTINIVLRTEAGFESQETPGFKFVPLIGKNGWKQ